jgi:hypothetical protein
METSIVTCARIGAAGYLLAAIVLPSSRTPAVALQPSRSAG